MFTILSHQEDASQNHQEKRFTLARMVIIFKNGNLSLVSLWRNWHPHTAGGDVRRCSCCGNSLAAPLGVDRGVPTGPSNSAPGCVCRGTEGGEPSRRSYAGVRSSITDNGQTVETNHVSINRRIRKQNVLYTYNKILFSLQKGNSDTC